ncbi:MAG TPA: hypothetical protein VNT79_14740 [Phycisphaerae bacterium]|nr:hypothetical protein [Phycisphaerae bacterium]
MNPSTPTHGRESPESARSSDPNFIALPSVRPSFWRRTLTFAGLLVLGVTPWAQAQLSEPNEPAYCSPLTSIANPTLFDMFWGTTPIRWPFQ